MDNERVEILLRLDLLEGGNEGIIEGDVSPEGLVVVDSRELAPEDAHVSRLRLGGAFVESLQGFP